VSEIQNSRHSGRSRLQNKKFQQKKKWPILKYVALSTIIFFASQTFLQVLKITKEGLQEAEGLKEEAKVCSFLWLNAFLLKLVPLQSLQDYCDGDVESLRAGVFGSFHQTVPGGLQVVVSIGHI
jgi:hypothetical protein